jgi:hypothetical protein
MVVAVVAITVNVVVVVVQPPHTTDARNAGSRAGCLRSGAGAADTAPVRRSPGLRRGA